MFERLQNMEKRYNELSLLLSRVEVASNQAEFQKYSREYAELSKIVALFRKYKDIEHQLEENQHLAKEIKNDKEFAELVELEIEELKAKSDKMKEDLRRSLMPRDPNDEKNVVVEIRAGTGGDEAALFAADLFRMYSKYAEKSGWRIEVLSSHATGLGGYKEIIAMVEGKGAYSKLKYESGTHRVQRVPDTEASGRIHTSTATVAILAEADEVEVNINPDDLRIDVFRSSGPGGQSVNTTDSAVRVTHLPTGITVSCQDEKSQHKNRAKAMKILRARLLDSMKKEQEEKISHERRIQVGSGDRSERIRTYNFPQGRVTDHRINLTLYKIESIIEGDIDHITEELRKAEEVEQLKVAHAVK